MQETKTIWDEEGCPVINVGINEVEKFKRNWNQQRIKGFCLLACFPELGLIQRNKEERLFSLSLGQPPSVMVAYAAWRDGDGVESDDEFPFWHRVYLV